MSFQKYLVFNAFGEGCFCLLKIFLFLSIHRLNFIQFLREIYMEKILEKFVWAPIPFKWYQNTYGCDTDRKRALTWNELTFVGNGLRLTVCLKISELFYRDMSINFFYFQKKNISIPWKCFSPSICQNVAIMKTTDWQLNHS